jgi:hypothetical protein
MHHRFSKTDFELLKFSFDEQTQVHRRGGNQCADDRREDADEFCTGEHEPVSSVEWISIALPGVLMGWLYVELLVRVWRWWGE